MFLFYQNHPCVPITPLICFIRITPVFTPLICFIRITLVFQLLLWFVLSESLLCSLLWFVLSESPLCSLLWFVLSESPLCSLHWFVLFCLSFYKFLIDTVVLKVMYFLFFIILARHVFLEEVIFEVNGVMTYSSLSIQPVSTLFPINLCWQNNIPM